MIIILSFLTLLSPDAKSESLIGSWSNCISNDPESDIEHVLTFDGKGLETEQYIMKEKSTLPCQGKLQFLLGTYWHYKSERSKFRSTTLSHFFKALDHEMAEKFSRTMVCGLSEWKIGIEVDCSNDQILMEDLEEVGEKGYKTIKRFFIKNGKLVIYVGKKVRIYEPK